MRIKIIAKTPDPKDSPVSSLGISTVYCGGIVQVVNADTGEKIEGIKSLELVLSPNNIIHARLEVEIIECDVDIEAEVM
jgi:hypothetical protein